MADIVFSVGSRPRISESEALELAGVLAVRRSNASARLADRIRAQVEKDADRKGPGPDIELDRYEAAELTRALQEHRWPEERRAFTQLRDELARHREGSGATGLKN